MTLAQKESRSKKKHPVEIDSFIFLVALRPADLAVLPDSLHFLTDKNVKNRKRYPALKFEQIALNFYRNRFPDRALFNYGLI